MRRNSARLECTVPLELYSPIGLLRLMTTVTTFATATDVTLAELKLEAFLQGGPPTSDALHAFAKERSAVQD
jgi:hypothetical protein